MKLKRIPRVLSQEWKRFRRVLRMFFEDRCVLWATAMSFGTLFAIVPLIVLAFPLVSNFQVFADTEANFRAFIFKHLVPSSGDTINSYITQFVERSTSLNVWGLIVLMLIAVSMLISIEHAFNNVFKVRKARPFIHKFAIYWTGITVTPFLIGLSFYLSNIIPNLLGENSFFAYLRYIWAHIFPLLLTWLAFFILYKIFPNKEIKTVPALIGSFVAACFWEIAKAAFSFFIPRAATVPQLYGPLSTFLLFMVWIEWSWINLLFCGELTYDIERQWLRSLRRKKRAPAPENYREFYALRIVQHMMDNFKQGKGPLKVSEVSRKLKLPLPFVDEVLKALESGELVAELPGKKGRYLLAKDPELMSFADVIFSINSNLFLFPEVEGERGKIGQVFQRVRRSLEDTLKAKGFDFQQKK
ncbi:MAG: YihY family inner membrane protein [Candidatus Aminicenantes bacterium]|nr:YihY family inner membrane protein [Candidatus Aminicenantes bacterium]